MICRADVDTTPPPSRPVASSATAGSWSHALTKSRGAPAPSQPLLDQNPCLCCGFADWPRRRLAVEVDVGGMMRETGQMEAVMLDPSSACRFSSPPWMSSLIKRSNTLYMKEADPRTDRPVMTTTPPPRSISRRSNPASPVPTPDDPSRWVPSGLDGATLTRPVQPPMPTRHDLAEPQHGPTSYWRVTLPLKLKTDVFIGA